MTKEERQKMAEARRKIRESERAKKYPYKMKGIHVRRDEFCNTGSPPKGLDKSCYCNTRVVSVEVWHDGRRVGVFTGPTADTSAKECAELIRHGSSSQPGTRCVADGLSLKSLCKK